MFHILHKTLALCLTPFMLTYKWFKRYWIYLPIFYQLDRSNEEVENAVNVSCAEILDRTYEQYPDKTCLIFKDSRISYRNLWLAANQVSRWALKRGLRYGDTVGLMSSNSPEMIAIILGLNRFGIITSLIHPALEGKSLKNTIKITKCKHLITNLENAHKFSKIGFNPKHLWTLGNKGLTKGQNITSELKELSDKALENIPDISKYHTAVYIFTSGTTGVPKACIISNRQLYTGSLAFKYTNQLSQSDTLLIFSPLCHSLGLNQLMATLATGSCCLLMEHFSVTKTWDYLKKYPITLLSYIGETSRFLVKKAPKIPKQHAPYLRALSGLQMAAEVQTWWLENFKVRIHEIYGATESNFILFNLDNTHGSIGWVPWFSRNQYGPRIIQHKHKQEKATSKYGAYKMCPHNTIGEMAAVIPDDLNERGYFNGYTDKMATKDKILRGLISRNDSWYLSGDDTYYDRRGYFYFKDRKGDTFRWKGENVSTIMVEDIISEHPDILECCVYGIEIPATSGKAGMCTLVLKSKSKELNKINLEAYMKTNLPSYAIPLFIRVTDTIEKTHTLKKIKKNFENEGCHLPAGSQDTLWKVNQKTGNIERIPLNKIQNYLDAA